MASQRSQNISLSLNRALNVEEGSAQASSYFFTYIVTWVIEETVLHARLADNLRAVLSTKMHRAFLQSWVLLALVGSMPYLTRRRSGLVFRNIPTHVGR